MELVLPAPKLYVTFGDEQQRKALEHEGIDCQPVEFGNRFGVTRLYESSNIRDVPVVIVSFREFYEPSDEISSTEIVSLFAHEAVHVAQLWCDTLGEDNPAEEEMAYMTQVAMYAILREYDNQAHLKGGEHV